ncbi:hypothetical protein Cni_G08909 [Canna indica]|uniref:Reverse transcriptase domain-containing protein n=1 Tax=Canna indica TaxID=4628 RepID=A0AAQ3Q8B8_9LILI|nr:hypothetical protein Cni_G08909 [Canna indica]
MKEINQIYEIGQIPSDWKETRLIMIPKVDKPKKVTGFRPIALCNNIYKIFAKILVNRIRGSLNYVIGKEQYAFIPRRCLHDSILVVIEIVCKISKSKARYPILVIKIDLEKVYDRVDWRIILKVMEYMNFPEKFRRWIKACVENVKYHCKVNGVNSRSFMSRKGIGQGDPLSPYLFIILEQRLTELIKQAVREKKIDCYNLEGNSISHTLFADDIVFFIKGNMKSCKNLMQVLKLYCNITGQKVNIQKSEVFFPKHIKRQNKQMVERILNFKVGTFPMKYLGTYISPRRLEKKYQMKLVQRAKEKVNSWTGSMLSQAGKGVLECSVKENKVNDNINTYQGARNVTEQNWMQYAFDGDILLCDGSWKDGLTAGAGFMLTNVSRWEMIGSRIMNAGNPLKAEVQAIWKSTTQIDEKSESMTAEAGSTYQHPSKMCKKIVTDEVFDIVSSGDSLSKLRQD